MGSHTVKAFANEHTFQDVDGDHTITEIVIVEGVRASAEGFAIYFIRIDDAGNFKLFWDGEASKVGQDYSPRNHSRRFMGCQRVKGDMKAELTLWSQVLQATKAERRMERAEEWRGGHYVICGELS